MLIDAVVTTEISLKESPSGVELNEEDGIVELSVRDVLTHKVSLPLQPEHVENLAAKWDVATQLLRLDISASLATILDSAHVSLPEQANPALEFKGISLKLGKAC